MSDTAPATIQLSLVSHTNVGKTTLMRTLLARDVGEVADRAHVTESAESHVLVESPAGDRLVLWDTPGFGDSARLQKRLAGSGNPIGWFLSQVWDRFLDRPLYSSQQAVRNVRDAADVVLYLANAAEAPGAAGYVEPELRILGWIGKPVVVLLNQTGPARGAEAEAADEAAWAQALSAHVPRNRVGTLDAFARCWVQEDRWLALVADVVAEGQRVAFARLRAAWRARSLATFDESMRVLAAQLARAACDREPVDKAAGGFLDGARRLAGSVTKKPAPADPAIDAALKTLATRLDDDVRASTTRLLELHGLSGRAAGDILEKLATHLEAEQPVNVALTGVMGGLVSGALGGLAADVAAGGVTLGAGTLIGGLLGALGVGGAAHAYNLARADRHGGARWSRDFLAARPVAALLRYLAVAHHGRGKGDWAEGETPQRWREAVEAEVSAREDAFTHAWTLADQGLDAGAVAQALEAPLREAARAVLERLYPRSASIWD